MVESEKRPEAESHEFETQQDVNAARCDACGSPMKPMGHCKYWCLRCGFLRTCNDVI